MKYFESTIEQQNKHGHAVCGDTCLCMRTTQSTILVLCDGVGSGVYANIASGCCASRLMSLVEAGMPFHTACETVADSMHRARTEDIPFSAFSAVRVFPDGSFAVYTYESPAPVLITNNTSQVLQPRYYTAGYEIIGESFGKISNDGDTIVIFSDGASQAGLGRGYMWGIGSEGIAEFFGDNARLMRDKSRLFQKALHMTAEKSGSYHADDTTFASLSCREANALNILSGPPSQKSLDKVFIEKFINSEGLHVICGSSTADLASRELKRKVEIIKSTSSSFASPPEYRMEGIEMVTEGAILLSQVYNILGENVEELTDFSPVEKICRLLCEADIITFMIGKAQNDAHRALIFKQVGVLPRLVIVEKIASKLREMGKLVVLEYY